MIACPMCSTALDPQQHRGLVINRQAYIRSQLMTLREQRERLRPIAASMHKNSESARTVLTSLEKQIEAYMAEYRALDEVEA